MNENIVIVGAKNSLVEEISRVVEENQDKVYFVKDSSENGWNRASPISARSNILQVKNVFEEIHKFVIIYDSSEYMRFNSFDVESISKGFDSTILGFSYFTSEIMKLYSEQGFGDFVFVVLDDEEREKSVIENVGLSAFNSLSESIANKKASKQNGIFLIKGGLEDLENNLDWFFSYLSNSNSKKAAGSPKHANKWIKFGGKTPVVLPFIK